LRKVKNLQIQAAVAQAAQEKFMRYELDLRGRQNAKNFASSAILTTESIESPGYNTATASAGFTP
jgi:hypothetical protein